MGGIFNARTQGRNGPRRENGIRRGWVPQPVGRGNPAPTIADILVTGEFASAFSPVSLHLCVIALNNSSRITLAHVAPLGL